MATRADVVEDQREKLRDMPGGFTVRDAQLRRDLLYGLSAKRVLHLARVERLVGARTDPRLRRSAQSSRLELLQDAGDSTRLSLHHLDNCSQDCRSRALAGLASETGCLFERLEKAHRLLALQVVRDLPAVLGELLHDGLVQSDVLLGRSVGTDVDV